MNRLIDHYHLFYSLIFFPLSYHAVTVRRRAVVREISAPYTADETSSSSAATKSAIEMNTSTDTVTVNNPITAATSSAAR